MKPRTKKALGATALALVLAVGLSVTWGLHRQHKQAELGGYEYAGIQPVPGATTVSMEYIDQSMFGGTTVWIYGLPPGYAQALYRDCSRIGYQQGTYLSAGGSYPNIDHYVKVDEPGCYLTRFTKEGDILAQFSGDRLIVQIIF